MDRTTHLRSLIDAGGTGLEIGPSHNPLLPKKAGFRAETVDYLDADGLRQKYAGNPHVDPLAIESVDHVLDGTQSLSDAIGRPHYYDYIVASHVIEHVPDPLGFLLSCETLLKADGVLLLAVPDKRHCFDVFQPLSTTGGVLQAHMDGHTRPTPGAVFDDRAYNAVRDGAIGWSTGATGELQFYADLRAATDSYQAAQSPGTYIDVHIWRFVPSSFRLILKDLNEIGEIGLKEGSFHDSVGSEFYMTFSCNAPGCPQTRIALARQALAEHATVST